MNLSQIGLSGSIATARSTMYGTRKGTMVGFNDAEYRQAKENEERRLPDLMQARVPEGPHSIQWIANMFDKNYNSIRRVLMQLQAVGKASRVKVSDRGTKYFWEVQHDAAILERIGRVDCCALDLASCMGGYTYRSKHHGITQ